MRELYNAGFQGSRTEFTAYRLLYLVYTEEHLDLIRLLQELTPELRKHEYIKHAISVYSAIAVKNYYKVFKYG